MANTEKINSSKVRQRLLMLFHEDGILDLVIGLTTLLLAGSLGFEDLVFIGTIGIPIVFYFLLKEQITYPRIGFVRFTYKGHSRWLFGLTSAIGLLTFFGVIALALRSDFLSSELLTAFEANGPYYFAGLTAGILGSIAYFMQNKRFGFYAMLGPIAIVAAQLMGTPIWIATAVLGFAMTATGAFHLIKFKRQYPIPEAEE